MPSKRGERRRRGGRVREEVRQILRATYAADETVPRGLVDHGVVLDVVDTNGSDSHPGFPSDPESESGDELPVELVFDRIGLHVDPGDIVAFRVETELHTVTSFAPKYSEEELELPWRVPTEYAFTSPPVVGGDVWRYRFTDPGVYDLLCLPHVVLGMVMRVVVSTDGRAPEDPYDALDIPNAGTVLGAEQLKPSNIVGEGSTGWDELAL